MGKSEEHPLITFAERYGDPTLDYLNAHTAMARMEVLTEDLNKVGLLLDQDSPTEERWHPWFGAEVISYYAVGYCTCLEWHAKSRLVDLLTFNPSATNVSDVRGTITDKLIVQMVVQNASVTQLIGAALKVSSFQTYMSVIGRVFTELGLPYSPREWLLGTMKDANVCWLGPDQLADLDRLFTFRHYLVHEIGIGTMGHFNVRDAWSPTEAKLIGRAVTCLIAGVEAALTKHAPPMFPNLLTEEGWPVGSATMLEIELQRLELELASAVKNSEWDDDYTGAAWNIASEKFAEYKSAENDFISKAGMLHWRYFDARTPLRLKMLRYRIEFLKELLSNFNTSVLDNPESTVQESQ